MDNNIAPHDKYKYNKINLIGKTNINSFGSEMKILNYINNRNVIVEFSNGYIVTTTYELFNNGKVRNVYDPSVFGVGYLGEGEYKTSINKITTLQYIKWTGMLMRCYNNKYQLKNPTYVGCSVIDKWHNFQNFAKWFDENYYEIEGQRMELDKDILVKGNKIYSPDTCVFVPNDINVLFAKSNSIRGDLPIGVHLTKNKKYRAQCNKGNNKMIYLGNYETPEEAFITYKVYKEKLIKTIADKYKDIIPTVLYNAMYSYNVEIDD